LLTWAEVFLVVVDLSIRTLLYATKLMLGFLTRWKLEGAMLLVGSLIFLIASAIQFVHA
jgi:hypothetical protein